MSKLYELHLVNGQKSFGGKALVEVHQDGSETLYSYCAPIIKRFANGELSRLYAGWSQTTGKHIKAFCGLDKAGFMALPHDLTPAEKAEAYTGTLYR